MTRRAAAHDYSRPGTYHITLHVAEGMGCPMGKVVGNAQAPDGHPDAPRVELSPIGQMVEHELRTALHAHYPMVEVQDYVVMPEHLHFLLRVKHKLVSSSGRSTHLGHIIKGFKYGCNRRYWEMLGLPVGEKRPTESVATLGTCDGTASVPADSIGSAYPSLFAAGFCDVMPVSEEQKETQRAYIHGNPRSRLLRIGHRDWLMPQRGAVPTALSVSALLGYLRRECAASTREGRETLAERLLTRTAEPAATVAAGSHGGSPFILCDSYGDRAMLERRLLPVVCHRRDKARFAAQKARCLAEAAAGSVLVSPRIAKGEQEIMDEAVHDGFPVVMIHDNGFPDRYHPSAAQLDRCAAGRLLLVTPWRYRYRAKQETLTVPECKAMNCLAQALCRTKDDWWKDRMQETTASDLLNKDKIVFRKL